MTAPFLRPSVETILGNHETRIGILEASTLLPTYPIKVFTDATLVTTGNGKFIMGVTAAEKLDGLRLAFVGAYITTVSSSGIVTVQLANLTAAVDMLSTRLTIDVGEFFSDTAATPAVIDPVNNLINTGDRLSIDVDVAGTGAKGLGVIMVFG